MTVRNITKSLAGVEDLLLGTGTEIQDRGAVSAQTINKIDLFQPVASLTALKALDTTKYSKAIVMADTGNAGLQYYFDSTSTATADNYLVVLPAAGAGRWRLANDIIKVFSSVAAMKADKTLVIGQTVQTTGYTSANDGGGATYKIVAAATGTDDGGSYHDLTGIVGQAELITTFNLRMESWNGEGDWDSFKAALAFNNEISAVGDSTVLMTSGGAPVLIPEKIIQYGKFKPAVSASYAVGSPGDINNFGGINLRDYNMTIRDVSFDGNGQGTTEAFNPAIVNVYFIPFVANDTTGVGGDRAKFRDLDIIDSGGHAIETGNVDMTTSIGCTGSGHNGIGSTNGDGHVYAGISSFDTHDSHFFINSVGETILTGCSARQTSNGGGVDMAGGNDNIVSSLVSTDSASAAVWILKSPNTGALINRFLVNGVISHNNSKSPVTGGSILIGDFNNPNDAQGQDVLVTSSLLSQTDTSGSGGSQFNSAVDTHKGMKKTTFTNNHITGVIAPSDANIIVDRGSEDSIYAYNHAQIGTTYAPLFIVNKPQGRGLVWRGNVGCRVDEASTYKPTVMVDDDGYWRYSLLHKPATTAQFDFVDLKYAGGFTRYIVELTISEGAGGGVLQKRITLKGASGLATTVHENVNVVSFDTAIAVSVDTTDTAKTRIKITPNTTETMSLALRVYGHQADMNNIVMWPSLV